MSTSSKRRRSQPSRIGTLGSHASTPIEPAMRDQVAVITGASSGIGKAIAAVFASQGAVTCLVGRKAESLKDAIAEMQASSSHAHAYRADLTRDGDVHSLVSRLRKDHGRVDILVHSAGCIRHGEHAAASTEDLDEQYRANVRGPYLLTKEILPLLRTGPGQIVFVNSTSGLTARARSGQFAATQHAMKAVADSLREEVNSHGIRVLNIFLGRTATPRTEILFEEEGKAYKPEVLMQPEDVAIMVVHALAVPRTAEVTEIRMRPLYKSY